MKSLKELMSEMGFNKDASVNSQKAFIKHLIASAQQTAPTKISSQTTKKKPTEPAPSNTSLREPEQLEFEFNKGKVS